MQKLSLAIKLKLDHADKLPQWYCDLNCFRMPEGFPLDLPSMADNRAKMKDPAYQLAWGAVCLALSEAGMSRAWWLIELGKTETEWKTWWDARRGVIAA